MTKITVWSVASENKITHNHIEDGWVDGDYPLPKKPEYTNQLSWSKMNWNKQFANLKDGKVLDYDLQEVK